MLFQYCIHSDKSNHTQCSLSSYEGLGTVPTHHHALLNSTFWQPLEEDVVFIGISQARNGSLPQPARVEVRLASVCKVGALFAIPFR